MQQSSTKQCVPQMKNLPKLIQLFIQYGRLSTKQPHVNGHTSPVCDLAWCPFNDNLLASCGEDAKIKVRIVYFFKEFHIQYRKAGSIFFKNPSPPWKGYFLSILCLFIIIHGTAFEEDVLCLFIIIRGGFLEGGTGIFSAELEEYTPLLIISKNLEKGVKTRSQLVNFGVTHQ